MVSAFSPAFGNRLSSVLELVGGLVGASKVIGVSDEQIGRWRSGRSKPQFFGLAALCDATGVSLDWLATGEGEMMRDARRGPPAFDVGLPLPEKAPAAIEPRVHVLAITKVESWLAQNPRRRMTPEKKAEAIALIYDMILEAVGNPARSETIDRQVERILRLVA